MPEKVSVKPIRIDINKVARDITVYVKLIGVKRWQWKIKIAEALIRLALCISGMGFVIEENDGRNSI